MTSERRSPVEQEPDRLGTRAIAIVAAVAFAVGALAIVATAVLLGRGERAAPVPAPRTDPVAGIEQGDIVRRARGLEKRRRAEQRLEQYGWVDRERGIAHIPIDRAIQWLVRDANRGELARRNGATP